MIDERERGTRATAQPGAPPLLDVRDLRTYFKTDDGIVQGGRRRLVQRRGRGRRSASSASPAPGRA